MALPDAVPRKQGAVRRYGITVLLVPTTVTGDLGYYDVEVQRAPDSAGAPDTGNAETIAQLPPIARTGTAFTDWLPNDGVRRHYRWRFVRIGYDAGAYSAWLVTAGLQGAKPVPLDSIPRMPAIAVNRDHVFANDGGYALRGNDTAGKEVFDDLWILATKAPKVGSAASPSSITKTLYLSFTDLEPDFNVAARLTFASSAIWPDVAATDTFLNSSFVLPPGVTITQIEARIYRETSSDTAQVQLWRDNDGTQTSLAAATHDGATPGWQSKTASLSELVDAGYSYLLRVYLKGAAAREDARFRRVKITYTMPSYDKGL